MIRLKTRRERLDLNIACDAATRLPLLTEEQNLLDLILAYQPLPYSVAEHGCGKKSDLILDQLVGLGIPLYALKRGMIMEDDMSDAALGQIEWIGRPHALTADNPLFHKVDFGDGVLLDMLDRIGVQAGDCAQIQAGPFLLSLDEKVQFRTARSHIFTVVLFWDEAANRPVERIVDPTLTAEKLLTFSGLRKSLSADQALVFTAPWLGRFRLVERRLTENQKMRLQRILDGKPLDRLTLQEHSEAVRRLSGASVGSIGDPNTWTYSNNILSRDELHDRRQRRLTGRGSAIVPRLGRMLKARMRRSDRVPHYRGSLEELLERMGAGRLLKEDARWSQRRLRPLAEVANAVSYYLALRQLANWIADHRGLTHSLDEAALPELRGIAVRLRDRIEKLADVSRDEQGRIDARALNPRFAAAVCAAIEQMNQAGLSVFIDKVGNLHGLLLEESEAERVRRGRMGLKRLTRRTICHCSHIDTVNDAGKYDGRLGVLSGIETAHILSDLRRYFGMPDPHNGRRLMVSAFIGEEMTFTGQGVSMPGSACVAGSCRPRQVHRMTDGKGRLFGDELTELLRTLKSRQLDGSLWLMNDLSGKDGKALLDACSDPPAFFTPHTFERHIEQGPQLDRWEVPLMQVDEIMGIHQQDLHVSGRQAEAAALEIDRLLRLLSQTNPQQDLRATVGIIECDSESRILHQPVFAQRWTLVGEKNHAGATLLDDRRDPAVAAARLVDTFYSLASGLSTGDDGPQPLVGGIHLEPGSNRNVIPEKASLTLGLEGGAPSEKDWQIITSHLYNEVAGRLSRPVRAGGEGLKACSVEPIDYLNIHSRVRLSLDIRAGARDAIDDFLQAVRLILSSVQRQFAVEIESAVQQTLRPFSLRRSGQVLQIERSYGGSHNPNEAELANDLLRGSLVQLLVTYDFLHSAAKTPSNLFRFAAQRVPREWTSDQRLISGALHDTCNIAQRVSQDRPTSPTGQRMAQ